MAVDKIRRGAAEGKVGYPNANTIRVDPTTDTLRFGTGVSGTTEKQGIDDTSVQTIGGAKTFSSPLTAGAGFVSASEVGSTATPLRNYGFSSIVSSTSVGDKAYTLALPVAGYTKSIANITGSTSQGTASVTSAAGGSFDSTGSTIATFSSQGYLNLVGVSSTRWAVTGIGANVALS